MMTSIKGTIFSTSLAIIFSSSTALGQPDTIGYIDSVTTNYAANHVSIKGWTCMSGENESIDAHVYLDDYAGNYGYHVGGATANLSSQQDVADACDNNHYANRFDIQLPYSITRFGGQGVWVHGINTQGGTNSPITNSGSLVIPLPSPMDLVMPIVTGIEGTAVAGPDGTTVNHDFTWDSQGYGVYYQVFSSDYSGDFIEFEVHTNGFYMKGIPSNPGYYRRYMVRACHNNLGCGIYGSSEFVELTY